MGGHLPKYLSPDDAVLVACPQDALIVSPDQAAVTRLPSRKQAATPEQKAPEPLRGARRISRQRVRISLRDGAAAVDDGVPCVRQHDLRVSVQRLDAALEQIPAVEIIGCGPLEERSEEHTSEL